MFIHTVYTSILQCVDAVLFLHTAIRKSRSQREAKADADVEKDGKFVGMTYYIITLRYIMYALESNNILLSWGSVK